MMINTVARRYAQALYDTAKKAGLEQEIGQQLEQLLRVLKADRELDLAFRSPALTAHRKRILLEQCFQGQLHAYVLNFCCLMWSKGREKTLSGAVAAYRELLRQEAGVLTAELTCAVNLTEEQLAPVRRVLEQRFGRPIAFDSQLDPSLLGGIRVRVGDTVLDGSVRGRLDALKERLRADMGKMSDASDTSQMPDMPDTPHMPDASHTSQMPDARYAAYARRFRYVANAGYAGYAAYARRFRYVANPGYAGHVPCRRKRAAARTR